MRCKVAAKPAQIESRIDPPDQVIVRHRIFEVELVEKLTLLAIKTAHHGSTSPRFASAERNHGSRPISTTSATKSANRRQRKYRKRTAASLCIRRLRQLCPARRRRRY